MQTKRKRKQWALLAFTMITAFMMQAITPLTVKAEEKIYTYSDFATLKRCEVGSSALYGPYHNEYISNLTITSNTPIKIGIIERSISDTYYRDGYWDCVIFCKDVTNIELTYMSDWTDFCDPCKYEDTHTAGMWTYNSDSFNELYNSDGELVGYYKKLFSSFRSVFDYYGVSDDENINYSHADFNNNLITYYANYGKNEEQNDCVLRKEDYNRFLKEVADGTIPPMNNGQFDESTAVYDETIPAPKMKVDNKLNYQFLNDDAGYMYQVKGRWRSIDDVTINAGAITDKMHYKSTVQCDLLQWVAPVDEVSTVETSSFATIGKDYFYNFLTMYPIENRNIHLSNTITNHDNWYEIPKYKTYYQNFKNCLSSFNSVEVYVRYFKKNDNGTFSYGKWTHYYNNITPSGSSDGGFRDGLGELSTEHFQSQNGLTNEELSDVENLEDSRTDTDVNNSINSSNGGVSYDDVKNELDFSQVTKVVLSLYEQAKVLFSMFTTAFSFLPTWAIELIAVSVVIVCFIGIWKVIR